MAEIEGKTVLCPGCPITGEFVGEVTPDALSIGIGDRQNIRFDARVWLTDKYGMNSEVTATTPVNRKSRADEAHAELSSGGKESICDRIRNCVGYTANFGVLREGVKEQRQCPALNTNVLDRLSKEG